MPQVISVPELNEELEFPDDISDVEISSAIDNLVRQKKTADVQTGLNATLNVMGQAQRAADIGIRAWEPPQLPVESQILQRAGDVQLSPELGAQLQAEHEAAQKAVEGMLESKAKQKDIEAGQRYYDVFFHGTPEERQALEEQQKIGTLTRGGTQALEQEAQLASLLPVSASQTSLLPPPLQVSPNDSITVAVGKEVLNLATAIPRFITTPLGLTSGGASAAFGPRVVSGAFTADMLHSLGQQTLDTYRNWHAMSPGEKTAAVIAMGGQAGFVGMAGKHAAGVEAPFFFASDEPMFTPLPQDIDTIARQALDPGRAGRWQAPELPRPVPPEGAVINRNIVFPKPSTEEGAQNAEAIRSNQRQLRETGQAVEGGETPSGNDLQQPTSGPPNVPARPYEERGQEGNAVVPATPLQGEEFTVKTPDREHEVSGRWEVIDSSQARRSDQPGYREEYQDRQKGGLSLEERAQKIAANFDPESLGTSVISSHGSPMIDEAGDTMTGNARRRAIEILYDSGRGDEYRAWLQKTAPTLGIDPKSFEALKRPELVRRVTNYGSLTETYGEKAPVEFARRSNISEVNELRESEQARSDVTALLNNPDVLIRFNPSEDGDVLAASNQTFLQHFFKTIGEPQNLRTAEGWNPGLMERRVKNAMLTLMVGREHEGLVKTLIEAPEDIGKNIVNGLLKAAPRFVDLRLKSAEYDPSKAIGKALSDLITIRGQGKIENAIDTFLSQHEMFGDPLRTAESDAWLEYLGKAGSPKEVARRLDSFVNSANLELERVQQPSLMGETPRTRKQIIEDLKNEFRKRPTSQQENLPIGKPAPVPGQPGLGQGQPAPAPAPEAPKPVQPKPAAKPEVAPEAAKPVAPAQPPVAKPKFDPEAAKRAKENLLKRLKKPPRDIEALGDFGPDVIRDESPGDPDQTPEGVPLDPTLLRELTTLAGNVIEARQAFAYPDYVKAMIQEVGDAFAPYFRDAYNEIRTHPLGAEWRDKLTSRADLELFDPLTGLAYSPEQVAKRKELAKKGDTSDNPIRPGLVWLDEASTPVPEPILKEGEFTGPEGYSLMQDQLTAVNLILEGNKKGHPGYLLSDGTGVGKTGIILAAASKAASISGKPSLIITINKMVLANNFKRDAAKFGIPMKDVYLHTIDDMVNDKLPKLQWGTIFFDEAHKLKNATSTRHFEAERLDADSKIYATATPMDGPTHAAYFLSKITGKSPDRIAADLGYRLEEIEDSRTGESRFIPKLFKDFTWAKVWENIVQHRNDAITQGLMIRREYPFFGKADWRDMQLDLRQRMESERILQYWDRLIENAFSANQRRNLAGQKTLEYSRWLELQKLPELIKAIEEDLKDPNKRIVVFGEGINDTIIRGLGGNDVGKVNPKTGKAPVGTRIPGLLRELEKYLNEKGIKFAKVFEDSATAKGFAAKKFQENGETRVLLATPTSGGAGLDMDDNVGRYPRVFHMATMNFAGDNFDQMVGRGSRRNTKSPVKLWIWRVPGAFSDMRRESVLGTKLKTLRRIQAGEDMDVDGFIDGTQRETTGKAGTLDDIAKDELADWEDQGPEPPQSINPPGASPDRGGLPAVVRFRGENFDRELLEASRRVNALMRYAPLNVKKGERGQYVPSANPAVMKDRIEVSDIRNQNTGAHELGHAIHWRLRPMGTGGAWKSVKIGKQFSGGEKEFRDELIPVSVVMRGPMNVGSKHYETYRRMGVELVADWFSMYAHDRDLALKMAPKFTAAFEKVLAEQPQIKAVVDELLAGNVTPIAPEVTADPSTGIEMPGKMPRALGLFATLNDYEISNAAADLVRRGVRLKEAQYQDARLMVEQWVKRIPNLKDREDVGAFIEGIGNLAIRGDTIADVRSRMTPAKYEWLKDVRKATEAHRQDVDKFLREYGEEEFLKFVEDYLAHIYSNKRATIKAAVSRWSKYSPHAKARTLPTLAEAVKEGLTPVSQDPAILYELMARANWRAAVSRAIISELRELRGSGGEPAILPAAKNPGGWPESNHPLIQVIYAKATKGGDTMLWRGGAAIHPDVWPVVRQILDNPTSGLIGQWYDAINNFSRAAIFALSFFHDLTLNMASVGAGRVSSKGFNRLNPVRGILRFGERDPVTGEKQLFQTARGAGKELLEDRDSVIDAVLHGLQFKFHDSNAYENAGRTVLSALAAKSRAVPFLGNAVRAANAISVWRNTMLWRNTHDALKLLAYYDTVGKIQKSAVEAGKPLNDAEMKKLKEQVASYLNDAFGGQERAVQFWSEPRVQKFFSRLLKAPDWTFSTIRSVPYVSDIATKAREKTFGVAFGPPSYNENLGNNLRSKFWFGELMMIAGAHMFLQYALYKMYGDDKKGDHAWIGDNEDENKYRIDVTPLMRKFSGDPNDKTRHYINLGKRAHEIWRWATNPLVNALAKMAVPIEEAMIQATGQEGDLPAEWKRGGESEITAFENMEMRLKHGLLSFAPFSARGWLSGSYNNNFALSVPMRKGMTKYKAIRAYEESLYLAAFPGPTREIGKRGIVGAAHGWFTEGDQKQRLENVLKAIDEAAIANGVDSRKAFQQALAAVHTGLNYKFIKAFAAKDEASMKDYAEALLRTGGGYSALLTSDQWKSKSLKVTRPAPNTPEAKMLSDAWRAAMAEQPRVPIRTTLLHPVTAP